MRKGYHSRAPTLAQFAAALRAMKQSGKGYALRQPWPTSRPTGVLDLADLPDRHL
ncbi:MAG: hypothetical protein RSE58_06130 [Clostridia bacterium]